MENISSTPAQNTTSAMDDDALAETLKVVMEYLLMGLMIVVMFSLGCTIELKHLKKTLTRPFGLIIGLVCQFILFPPITFGLAHALQVSKWNALGMVILGTCPGGSFSNFYTYIAKGDVPLSVSMTAVSTAVGIGMMPLNLWIYSRSWTDESAAIPFVNIIIALVTIIVPVSAGMFVLVKFPRATKWIIRVGGVLGFLIILFTIAVTGYMAPDLVVDTTWRLWLGAVLLPGIGLAIGYLLSTIAHRQHDERRAIAIEVSVQNVSLCMALISISFDADSYMKVWLFPQMFGLFSLIEIMAFIAVYRIYACVRKRREKKETVTKPVENSYAISVEKGVVNTGFDKL